MSLRHGEGWEAAFWIALAVVAFAMTFQFDQPIEIYEFGAAGWPRVVLVLMFAAAVGQLWMQRRQRRRPSSGNGRNCDDPLPMRASGDVRVVSPRLAAIFGLPVAYAALLDYVGFYFVAPVLCVGYLYTTGERHWGRIIGITLFIYALLLTVFVKIFYVGLPIGYVSPFYDFSNWLLVTIR